MSSRLCICRSWLVGHFLSFRLYVCPLVGLDSGPVGHLSQVCNCVIHVTGQPYSIDWSSAFLSLSSSLSFGQRPRRSTILFKSKLRALMFIHFLFQINGNSGQFNWPDLGIQSFVTHTGLAIAMLMRGGIFEDRFILRRWNYSERGSQNREHPYRQLRCSLPQASKVVASSLF